MALKKGTKICFYNWPLVGIPQYKCNLQTSSKQIQKKINHNRGIISNVGSVTWRSEWTLNYKTGWDKGLCGAGTMWSHNWHVPNQMAPVTIQSQLLWNNKPCNVKAAPFKCTFEGEAFAAWFYEQLSMAGSVPKHQCFSASHTWYPAWRWSPTGHHSESSYICPNVLWAS